MIKNIELLSMAEAEGYLDKNEDSEEVDAFIKKFVKISPDEAKDLRKKLESLEIMKLNPESIIKIIDLLPENKEDLNKIFNSVSLDEDETKKILETIKEFK